MTSPPKKARSASALLLTIILIGAVSFAGYSWWQSQRALAAQTTKLAAMHDSLELLLGEVTRMRLEQTSKGQGPLALLEKLKIYAPMTSNSRITEPDFQNAKKELVAIVRAFEASGEEAWQPLIERLEACDPRKDFDEIKWLLEIALRIDPPAGKQIVKDVLLGYRLPYPRLRWWAADLLIAHDTQLAQTLLRRILLTESSRGINRSRAQGQPIPDQAAFSTTGFNNFVTRYIRTDDPQLEDTLLMLLSRIEHDAITIQECVKELGNRKSARAAKAIKRVYKNPPLEQQNPLFLNKCSTAIYQIEGEAAKGWLEEQMMNAPTDNVANHLQSLLNKIK